MPFLNRWKIEWPMTTDSPLHIGDGGFTTHPEIHENKDKSKLTQISWVANGFDHRDKNFNHRAYVPGTALKGCIRSWLKEHLKNAGDPQSDVAKQIEQVFGSEDTRKEANYGGKAEFHNAFFEKINPSATDHVPYWREERLTGVSASVAIDRSTKTAAEGKLFYHEFVPRGITFRFSITAQDLLDDELSLILVALQGFKDEFSPITLGASEGDDYGRFTYEEKDIEISSIQSKADILAWIKAPQKPVGFAGLKPIIDTERDKKIEAAREKYPIIQTPSLRVGLELYFDGPFLVNDPSQCTDEDNDITEDGNKKPDHAPLCDKNGKAYLPGKAVRGPVRSQAERILRTLREDVACRVTDRNDACKAVYTEDEVREKEKLCMACHVFGASGWRTLVDFSDFHEVNDHQESFDQEFVAIDRFIGGVSGSAKFDAKAVYKPILKGEVTVDLDRIPLWGLGLLALTLRDLIEGDTQFGFGSGKGYAACTAKITSLTSVALEKYKALEELRERHKIDPDELTQLDVSGIPRQEIQNMLGDIVGLFHTAVKEFRRSVPVQGGING